MFLDTEKLNKIIVVTVVSAYQLAKDLTDDKLVLKKYIMDALALQLTDVVYEYNYVSNVVDITLDWLINGKTKKFTELAF